MTERLIPVPPTTHLGEDGTYQLVTRLTVKDHGWTNVDRIVKDAISIHRVETEPDLPTWPGALILCEVEGFGEQYATLKTVGNQAGPGVWLIPGHDNHIPADQITRVIEVIRPGIDPRPKPGPRPGPAVSR